MAEPATLREQAAALRRLARLHSIQTRHTDGLGQRRIASTPALLAVLRAAGVDIDRAADAPAMLDDLREQRRLRLCPPVVVAWRSARPHVHLHLLDADREGSIRATLGFQGGGEHAWEVDAASIPPVEGSVDDAFRRLDLPRDLPIGRHALRIETASEAAETTVLAAPRRAWRPRGDDRRLGLFVPTYALRSQRNLGVGDLADLRTLLEWTADRGGRLLGTLPLLANFLDEPIDASPYSPISRLVFSELFIDVDDAPDLERAPEVRALLQSPDAARTLQSLRRSALVDYREAWRLKRAALAHLASAAWKDDDRRAELDAFAQQRPLLAEYAAFRAVVRREKAGWPGWQQPGRPGALREGEHFDERDRRTYLYAQWLLDRQLRSLADRARQRGCELYLDLPIGVNGGGFDTWRWRELFGRGVSVGAPPDQLFSKGQDWGFAPVLPEASRAEGHGYLFDAFDRHLALCGALRIDHVMALHRLYWVPEGFDAAEGVYVRYPADELWALVTIASHHRQATIIGENLGTVPREVTDAMAGHEVLGMSIAQFEIGASEERPLPRPGHGELAALNTHDMPTFASYWEGRDIDLYRRLDIFGEQQAAAQAQERERIRERTISALRQRGLLDENLDKSWDVLCGLLGLLARSPAEILLVNLEDLWLEPDPQNVPGTTVEVPNWRRIAARTLEQIVEDGRLRDLVDWLVRERREAGEAAGVARAEGAA